MGGEIMRICSKCGTINADDARFCENCGTKLEGEPITAPSAEEPADSEPVVPGAETGEAAQTAGTAGDISSAEMGSAGDDFRSQETAGQETAGQEAAGQESVEHDPAEHRSADQEQVVRPSQRRRQQQQQSAQQQDSARKQVTIKKPDVGKMKTGIRKLTKLQKIVIAEVICLAVVIAAFFVIGDRKYSAQSVAERYFEAYVSHDWKTVYGLLELPDGSFMQESQFEEMMEKTQVPDITNYTVRQQTGAEGGIVQNFNVEYSVSGQGTSSSQLSLVRQSDKAMFLFDTWKVSAAGMLVENYPVTVPAGARAAVDGVELTEEYMVSNNADGTDTYQISLFNGVHTITAAVPWCEVYEGEFDTSAEGSVIVENLTLTDTGKTALQAKMQEALESFYTSALAGDDFSAVSGLFAENAAAEYEDTYNDLRDRLTDDPDDYYTLNQITFDDFCCSFNAESGTISGEMDCDYTVDYTYTYSGFGSSRTENETNDGSAYVGATFVYEGDTYKLQYVNIPNVWWY